MSVVYGTRARAGIAGRAAAALDGGDVIYSRRGLPPLPAHPIYYNNIILYTVHDRVTYITMSSCELASVRTYTYFYL